MSDIERRVGTNSRNVSAGNPHDRRSGPAMEVDELDAHAAHISRLDPDLGHGEEWGAGFTWITLERQETPRTPTPPGRRSHLGWSLIIATGANLILGAVAIATGATLVGVVACSALSIATCMLVLAEIAGRYGIDPVGRRPPDLGDHYIDDR